MRQFTHSILYYCISILLISCFLISCRTKDTLTKRLYFQSKGINIEIPKNDDGSDHILSEISEKKTNTDDTKNEQISEKKDIYKEVELEEVNIIAKRSTIDRIAEIEGYVYLGFKITVPKTLLDSNWQLILNPRLFDRDTNYTIPPVILRGENFIALQEKQYKEYDEYLNTIIPLEKYDSAFVYWKGIRNDIYKRQEYFYEKLEKERTLLMDYENWRQLVWDRYTWQNAAAEGNRETLKQRLKRKALEQSIRQFVETKDSVGIRNAYTKGYNRRIKFNPIYKDQKELELRNVPKKYKPFFINNTQLEDIRNHEFTDTDSIEIAKFRYDRKAIAINEAKKNKIEDIKKQIIRYPYINDTKYYNPANPTVDFVYPYTYKLKLRDDMKKLRVTVEGLVEATDNSIWNIPHTDTLTFIIASLSELADTNAVHQYETLTDNRWVSSSQSREYRNAINALQNRDYKTAYATLESYADYNTALTLTLMGDGIKADKMLSAHEQTAQVEYLRAIVNKRLGRDKYAKFFLLEACEKDIRYAYRVNLDTDMKEFVMNTYGLREKIDELIKNN